MKNLLNNAVEGLMERVENNFKELRHDINAAETRGIAMNILADKRILITNQLDKLRFVKEQMEVRFPEEDIRYIDKFIDNGFIQLQDINYIAEDLKLDLAIQC